MLFRQWLSLCESVSAWFHLLELATVGGRFFFSKRGLTCCQGGRHFYLLWGRAINLSKNLSKNDHMGSLCRISSFWRVEVASELMLALENGALATFYFDLPQKRETWAAIWQGLAG